MYCPTCFQNTLKLHSSGVVKLSFNGKSRNNSLFTYNLQKDSQDQLEAKLKEKILDFFSFYASMNNKSPIKNFEIYTADFLCVNSCKLDRTSMKVSVIGIIFTAKKVQNMLEKEAQNFNIPIEIHL